MGAVTGTPAEAVALVRLVEAELGGGVVDVTSLAGASPRSTVLRLTVVAPSGPKTVVAKQVRVADVVNQPSGSVPSPLAAGTSGEREATARYANEVAAYRRLQRVGCAAVPRLVAAMAAERVIVLEHVEGWDIIEDLWGDDVERSSAALGALAVALAEAHGAGMHRSVAPSGDELEGAWAAALPPVRAAAAHLAATTGLSDADWACEVDDLHARLAVPGPFATWLHGDPCPGGNVIFDGERVRLVDLEAARPGHAVLEAAYLRCGFPTCWSVGVAGSASLRAAEDAYRRALAPACPAVADDATWRRCLADACAWWALDGGALVQRAERGGVNLVQLALERDWEWGTATARQRLRLRLDQAAALLAGAGHAPALADLLAAAVTQVAELGAGQAPGYPALGGGGG